MQSVHVNPFDQFKSFKPDFWQFELNPRSSSHDDQTGNSIKHLDSLTKVQRILNQTLSEHLGFTARRASLEKLNNDFDANAVANSVLGFVNNRLDHAAAEGKAQDQLQSLREQAKSGVEQGIKEAREALQGMGLLSSSIDEGISQMRAKIFQGLEAASTVGLAQPRDRLIEADHYVELFNDSSFELQVKTQDGDLVTIQIQQQEREEGGFSLRKMDDENQFNLQHAKVSQTQLIHSVEGELDEDELGAINSLVEDIRQLSNDFFDGNVQAAFEQGLSLGYNPEEIAAFSIELYHSVTSLATTRYREISALDSMVTPKLPGLEQVRDLLEQMNNVLKQADKLFEDARPVTSEIMQGFMFQHPKAEAFLERLSQQDDHDLDEEVERLLDRAAEIEED